MISSGAGGRRHSLSDMKNDAIAVAAAAAKSAARAAATSTNKEAEMTSAVMMDRAHATNSSFAKITLSNKPNQSLNCEERAVSNNNNNKKKAAKKKSSSVIDGMKSEEKSEEEVAAVKIFEGDNNRLGNSSEEAAEILFHKSLTAVCSKENRPQLPRPNITTSTSLNSGTKLPPAECLDNPNNELLLLKKSQRPSSVPPTKKLDETVKLKKKKVSSLLLHQCPPTCTSFALRLFQDSFSLCDLTYDSNATLPDEKSNYSSGYLSQESLIQLKKDLDARVNPASATTTTTTTPSAKEEGGCCNSSSTPKIPTRNTNCEKSVSNLDPQSTRSKINKLASEQKCLDSGIERQFVLPRGSSSGSSTATTTNKEEMRGRVEGSSSSSSPKLRNGERDESSSNVAMGFSHLEWSASVPYNLAEEPDEVCGMKHSHSCQSMPALEHLTRGLESSSSICSPEGDRKTLTGSGEQQQQQQQSGAGSSIGGSRLLHLIKEIQSNDSHGCENSDDSQETIQDISPKFNHKHEMPKEDVRKESFTAINTELYTTAQREHVDKSSASLVAKIGADSGSTIPNTTGVPHSALVVRESQEALSKKLDEVRQKSRSTARDGLISQRVRAKSEEAAKFPEEFKPRTRLRSEGSTLEPTREEIISVPPADDGKKCGTSKKKLEAPKLVQTLTNASQQSSEAVVMNGGSSRQHGSKPPAAPNVPGATTIPPPPVQFRDPPGGKKEEASRFQTATSAGTERARQIQKSLEEKMLKRRSQYEMQRKSAFLVDDEDVVVCRDRAAKSKSFDVGDLFQIGAGENNKPPSSESTQDLEGMQSLANRNHQTSTPIPEEKEGGTVPMRRKLKDVSEETSSLSRLEAKKRGTKSAADDEDHPPQQPLPPPVVDDPLNKTSCTSKIVGRTVVRRKDPEDNYFLVERTGDCLETKSLPKPPIRQKR